MPPKSHSPTIREIAAQTGYSRSTVGAALQNRPDIAESTRRKIHKAAEKMGYQQDAEIRRLMSYLRRRRGTRESVSIALLHDAGGNARWLEAAWNKSFWQGMKAQAEYLGFDVNLIDAGEYRRDRRRIASVLAARGIRGVVFDGTVDNQTVAGAQLSAFCGVHVGTHPWESLYHSACPDFAHNIHLALRKVAELGYERPGLALLDFLEERTNHLYHGTYLWWQQAEVKAKNRIRPLVYGYSGNPHSALIKWIRSKQPDVLLLNDQTALKKLHAAGFKVPDDIALVHLNLAEDVPGWSGIDQGRDRLGQAAVDILSAQFSRGDSGPPDMPRTVMIRGHWHEGATT